MEFLNTKINTNTTNLSTKKAYKKLIFFKKLFYLSKILKEFYHKEEGYNNFVNSDLFNKLINSKIFTENEEFLDLGIFQHIPDVTKNNNDCIVNIHYRKSVIEGIELIDLIMDDITTIIKVEEEKADNKYRRQYLSNVAHEFKAPIQVLLSTVLDINTEGLSMKELKKFEDLEHLANYILILIMDIISFSKDNNGIEVKYDQFPRELPFDFGFKLLNLLIKNNNSKKYAIKANLIINDNVPRVLNSDETKIKQVLINLISNSFKFTYNGEINIYVDKIDSNNLYDEIEVKVEDTGIGIKTEDEHKLFKQFGKLTDFNNQNRQGTGLGLSICKNVIESIGSDIGYKLRKAGGSLFYFSFYSIKNDNLVQEIENQNFNKISQTIEGFLLSQKGDTNSTDKQPSKLSIPKLLKKDVIEDQVYCNLLKRFVNRSPAKKLNKFEIEHNLENLDFNDNTICIPLEAYDFYHITANDSIYLDNNYDINDKYNSNEEKIILNTNTKLRTNSIPTNDNINENIEIIEKDKIINLFHGIYNLAKKYSKDSDFLKVFHHFKPYFRFFKSKINQIITKANIKYFCIADDNGVVLKSLSRVIKSSLESKDNAKIEVLKAYDGVEALALFKIDYFLGHNIKYFITDQNMTMMSGMDLINLVKKYADKKQPIDLYISSSDNDNLKDYNTMQNFLPKPISKKEIKKIIGKEI